MKGKKKPWKVILIFIAIIIIISIFLILLQSFGVLDIPSLNIVPLSSGGSSAGGGLG